MLQRERRFGGSAGGQILERGSHYIDLQRAIAGEIKAVEAVGGPVRLGRPTDAGGSIEDVVALVFHFQGGAVGSVNMAWMPEGHPEVYTVDVIASNSSIWLELGPQNFRLTGVAAGVELHAQYGDPFDRSIGRFLEVARSGDLSRVFCTPDDALHTLIVALSCERALAENRTVVVEM
jgi:predicted dehydrogenase